MDKLKRSAYGGKLRESDIDSVVTTTGWVARRRDLGGVIFIDLRDKSGIIQVVFDAKNLSTEDFEVAEHLKNESVIAVRGIIEKRDEETINENLLTGTIDLRAEKLELLSEAQNPPFPIDEGESVNEELRLKYRYLDLRRPEMREKLVFRQNVLTSIRNFLVDGEFLEIDTPILTKSTPEGARDYLVPSRLSKGEFYALPQSPQIYKQLLMVGGMDKYFQVAKCFRDEDLRADRQPEFTQVDMELSFVDENDVIEIVEALFVKLFKETLDVTIKTPMRRMTYREAMDKYGFDKPDLRFEMPMVDLSDLMKTCQFDVFKKVVETGGIVKAISVTGGADFTRTQIETLTKYAVSYGGQGMAWIAIDKDGSLRSILTKYFSQKDLDGIMATVGAKPGDLIIFCADKAEKVRHILGHLRLDVGDMLDLRKNDQFAFTIITEFPLFEWDESGKRFVAMHHPFTMPKEEDIPMMTGDLAKVRAKAYDFVLNGIELGSGSIRIHDSAVQEKMFSQIGLSDEEINNRFGFMINAFKYGVPPHGGFAFGLDRLLMLMLGTKSIREVIAFPKMRDGSCAMINSPSKVDSKQLEELQLYLEAGHETATVKPKIDMAAVDYVSKLSRLELEDDEKEELTKNLLDIIEFADKLTELDTRDVPALDHILPIQNVFRKDEVEASFEVDKLMKSAPKVHENYFYVPKTVE